MVLKRGQVFQVIVKKQVKVHSTDNNLQTHVLFHQVFFFVILGLMIYVLFFDRVVCLTFEDDGGLPVVWVVKGTDKVVPTEAWVDIIKKKHTTRYLGADKEVEVSGPLGWESWWEGFEALGLVFTAIGWRQSGGHTCECQRLRTLVATWKLHLWGKMGGGGRGGGSGYM